jgi:hypothetical protein
VRTRLRRRPQPPSPLIELITNDSATAPGSAARPPSTRTC